MEALQLPLKKQSETQALLPDHQRELRDLMRVFKVNVNAIQRQRIQNGILGETSET